MDDHYGHPAYQIVATFSRWYFATVHRIEYHGVHYIPACGGFILASNHASFYDPPAVGVGFPRPIYYFARKTLFQGPFNWLLPRLNTIPVDRDGESDVGAIKTVFRVLRGGHGVMFFPEGTRSPDGMLQPPRKGIGMIAAKAGVPVVPARIFGSHKAFSRIQRRPSPEVRLTVVYGSPVLPSQLDPGPRDPDRYGTVAQRIMDRIAALPCPAPLVL